MYVTPAVAGDLVLAGSCSGVYYAFDARTGAVVWTYDTREAGGPKNFHGDPVITEELVVTPSDGVGPAYTYALERHGGAVRWMRPGAIITDLVRFEQWVVGLEQETGDLVAIDIEGGGTVWRVAPEAPGRPGIDNSPVVVGETVYSPGPDGSVRAVRVASGQTLWRTEIGCGINTGLAIRGGDLYLGCFDGRLFRLSMADGDVTGEGRLDAGFPFGQPVAVDGAVVYLVGDNPRAGGGSRLVAFAPDLASTRWEAVDAATWSSMQPLLWRGLLVVGNGDGEVVALRPGDGSVAWRRQLTGTIRGLGATEELLLVGTLKGTIFALETG